MAIPSFYHPRLSRAESVITLSATEASHAIKSRRLRLGDKVRVFNGLGTIAYGELSVVERRQVSVQINSIEQVKKTDAGLTIAVAVPKGDRQKVMLDMLTQLAVFEIIPLRCEHSVSRFGNNMAEKWRRATIEAAKQSQNPWLPLIASALDVSDLLREHKGKFAYADAEGVNLSEVLNHDYGLTAIIGPEGGFSTSELAMFKERQIPPFKLGRHILRTEAAAIAAAAQYNLVCQ